MEKLGGFILFLIVADTAEFYFEVRTTLEKMNDLVKESPHLFLPPRVDFVCLVPEKSRIGF